MLLWPPPRKKSYVYVTRTGGILALYQLACNTVDLYVYVKYFYAYLMLLHTVHTCPVSSVEQLCFYYECKQWLLQPIKRTLQHVYIADNAVRGSWWHSRPWHWPFTSTVQDTRPGCVRTTESQQQACLCHCKRLHVANLCLFCVPSSVSLSL